MGLDVSHGAFSAAYSAFNQFRRAVCWAAGGSFPPHDDVGRLAELGLRQDDDPVRRFLGPGAKDPPCETVASEGRFYLPDAVTRDLHPGLYAFLEHSDCDGELSPAECRLVADELGGLADKIGQTPVVATGHIERDGGFRAVLERFVGGCRAAADANEPLLFR